MSRATTVLAVLVAINLLIFGIERIEAAGDPPASYLGLTAKQWHGRAVLRTQQRNAIRRLAIVHRRAYVHRPSSLEAIRLASVAYGQSYSKLLRIASCESGLYRYAKNPRSSATGLFQFLYPSTWRSTPFASESVWSPYASALAAAWMQRAGRGGEWVCQ